VLDFWLTVSKEGEAFHQQLDGGCLGNERHVVGSLLRQSAILLLNHDRHELIREAEEETPRPTSLMQEALSFVTYLGLTKSQLDHEMEIIQEFVWPNERYQKRTVLAVNPADPDSQFF
jgi:hypothetical protein